MRVFLLLLVVGGIIAIYLNTYTSDAQTNLNILEPVYTSIALVEYGGELSQIHGLVSDFLALRESVDSPDAKSKAVQLDDKINGLEVVQKYCTEKISTLDLALDTDPYGKLQQICPVLKNLPFSKAEQFFSRL
jgi:hypothetical protein